MQWNIEAGCCKGKPRSHTGAVTAAPNIYNRPIQSAIWSLCGAQSLPGLLSWITSVFQVPYTKIIEIVLLKWDRQGIYNFEFWKGGSRLNENKPQHTQFSLSCPWFLILNSDFYAIITNLQEGEISQDYCLLLLVLPILLDILILQGFLMVLFSFIPNSHEIS